MSGVRPTNWRWLFIERPMHCPRVRFSASPYKYDGLRLRFPPGLQKAVGEKVTWSSQLNFTKRARPRLNLEYLLLLCKDLGYLPSETYEALREDVVTVRKMLSGLLRRM